MTRRSPEQYSWDDCAFDETLMEKHFTKQDSKQVKYIVVHHEIVLDRDVNAPDALDKVWNIWQTREASAQYAIDGRFIRQFVWDKDYAWACGNTDGNRYGIHIEHTNSTLDEPGIDHDYLVSEETWKNGAKLVAHLHKKHNLGRPIKDVTVRKHNSFKATGCPGPFLGGVIWQAYNDEVVRIYEEITGTFPFPNYPPPVVPTPAPPVPSPPPKPLPERARTSRVQAALEVSVDGFWGNKTDATALMMRAAARAKAGYPMNTPGAFNVEEVQQIIDTKSDGIWGTKSQAALVAWVKEFQSAMGVTADGAWGPQTDNVFLDMRARNLNNF